MVEEGTITKVMGSKAWVLVCRSSMCDGCQSRSVCKTLGGGKDMESEAKNIAGGKVGDRVLLKIDTGSFLWIAFLVYIIPVLSLIAGALIGMKLGAEYSLNPEITALGSGVSAFALAFLILHRFGKRERENQKYMPKVVKIISSEQAI